MKIIIYQKGGLGNQFYQYTFAKYLSNKFKADIIIDITYYKYDSFIGNTHREYELNKIISNIYVRSSFYFLLFNFIAYKLFKNNCKYFFLTDKNFDSNITLSINKNIKFLILNGYFQNNINILKHIDLLLFTKLTFTLNQNINYTDSLCIHIRKNDYVKLNSIYTNLTSSYFLTGINYLNNKYKIQHTIYIFTDDLTWVKDNILINKLYIFKIISTNSAIIDFQFLSTFNKIILSNSTFSLWSVFISLKDKMDVIAPKNWYVDEYQNSEFLKNNIPESFILI